MKVSKQVRWYSIRVLFIYCFSNTMSLDKLFFTYCCQVFTYAFCLYSMEVGIFRHREVASQLEVCILLKLHHLVEGCLNLREPWKAAFCRHVLKDASKYPLRPPITHNPLHTLEFTKIDWQILSTELIQFHY